MDDKLKDSIVEMLNEGMSPQTISEKVHYDSSYIYYILHKKGVTTEEIQSKVKNKYRRIGKKYNFIDTGNGKLLFTGSQTEASRYFKKNPASIWNCVHLGNDKMKVEVCED